MVWLWLIWKDLNVLGVVDTDIDIDKEQILRHTQIQLHTLEGKYIINECTCHPQAAGLYIIQTEDKPLTFDYNYRYFYW